MCVISTKMHVVCFIQPTEGQEKTTPSVEDIDALIPRVTSLKSMLKILALLCDEQTRSLQNYLRKQPGRINSVNIVGSVVELLTHVHRLYENSKLSVPPRYVFVSKARCLNKVDTCNNLVIAIKYLSEFSVRMHRHL